jgi:hypothetical protein
VPPLATAKPLYRIADAFREPSRLVDRDLLIGAVCRHAHLQWLQGKSLLRLQQDVMDMRHICEKRMVAAYSNPFRALLVPLSDPIVVPWQVHHECFLPEGLQEDAAAIDERDLTSPTLIAGLIFAGYLKHVGRFADARSIYRRMISTGSRFEGYFGLADIQHLLANWSAEVEPYRQGGYYRPHLTVARSRFQVPAKVDSHPHLVAIALYEHALAERPDSTIARRSLGRALIDAELDERGVEEFAKIETVSPLARQLKAYTLAVSPRHSDRDDLDALMGGLPCLPYTPAKMRRFEVVTTRDAAAALGARAVLMSESHQFSGTYIADSDGPDTIEIRLSFPEIWASTFEEARSPGHGLLIVGDRYLITDGKGLSGRHRKLFSIDLYAVSETRAVVDLWPNQHAVAGSAILLIGVVYNYYHWILETLPALMMLKADPSMADATIYLELPPQPFQIESYRVAFPGASLPVVISENIRQCSFERVHHIQNSSSYMVPRPGSVLMMRRAMSRHVSVPKSGKRVYLSRKSAGTRQNQNEKSLQQLLTRYGIEAVDTGHMTVEEQIEFFKDVELVVAPAGAALTNLIYCPGSTRVVIMTSGAHHFETFTAIAAAIGQPCWVSAGSGRIHPNPYFLWTSFDLTVNIPSLRRCLESAIASLSLKA